MTEKEIVVCYLKRREGDHPEREQLAREIAAWLEKNYGLKLRLMNLKDLSREPEFSGIVICVGGDGVLLGGTHVFTNPQNHFLLVGAKGKSAAFYAQSDYQAYQEDLSWVMDGNYDMMGATRIRVVTRDGKFQSPSCLNELAFKERNVGQMFSYELEVEGKQIYRRSKGGCSTIIFATPCGSTAWGLAAGGSIIFEKDSRQLAITPESPVNSIKADPYNLANLERDRYSFLAPGIFPMDCSINFKPLVDTVLIKDGRWWNNDYFPAGTEFTITKGEPLNLVRLKEKGFWSR